MAAGMPTRKIFLKMGISAFSALTLTLTGSPANRYGKHPVPYGLER